MIDNFKTDLVLRVAAIPHDEILRAMGYQKPTSANLERLQNVLDDPEFGLNDGGFDFKYSGIWRLRKRSKINHKRNERRNEKYSC